LYSALYVVEEGQQVVITQFKRPVRAVTDAGLGLKTPFIQEVHRLEKRLLPWDGEPENMQTRDKKRIFIDVWARWRIADPMKFFRDVKTEERGQKILDDIVDSVVRDVVARHDLIDVVRTTNEELVYDEHEELSSASHEVVTTGRAEIERLILSAAGSNLGEQYGMELSGVHVKRISYVESVRQTVYERMRSERLRIAKRYESEAEEEKNRILGQMQKELDLIEGEMEQRSAEIRGQADAKVITLTAEGYGKSPEFYRFLRQLEVFKKTFGGETRLILSTQSDLFQMLKKMSEE
jgi:membrane protease subunit HflC